MNSNKKAVVIGGSNGIGLAISRQLMNRGYRVCILDIMEPDAAAELPADGYEYHAFNMLDVDENLLETLRDDSAVEVLMLTAGIGRIAPFGELHPVEIEKTMQIDATASIRIFRTFYPRIQGRDRFFCGIMGSIAGLVSSPLFSVYAAAKAAVCRFVESVNIELEVAGSPNRILNVSPGSIRGTRFNGGANDLSETETLSAEIVERMFRAETLYIPKYEETFRGVIESYQNDPHAYGLHSYEYKQNSGRASSRRGCRVGYLSGTFDLFHVGHLNLLRRAKEQCDYLIVGVHPDASHKGKQTYIPFEERMAVVGGCRYVDQVVPSCREDSDAWDLWHYDRLFVGSDYKGTERFRRYEEYFVDKGVTIIYFPYTKSTSSTQIRNQIQNSASSEQDKA